ncbi:GDSL esterase/lipase 5 [Morella rubra]|uniref:GDSL esterase/lipase 5 n=1 Tax=Morella rubra TaxID=262757 RepID=A0A6A1W5V4_9ROSI|nr:GDSL esterase/lipase 5 [Morella rubra]
MARLISHSDYFVICTAALVLAISCETCASTQPPASFFIFGDSTVDAGNNNYINTIPIMKANYTPYGESYFERPTGRFSDGLVAVDFIAEYAGLPLIPPFLQPSAEFIHGVNFASGGAGVLPETNQGLVIDLQTQIEYFEDVRVSLKQKLGKAKARKLIKKAVYFISIGSNDYLGGYVLGNPQVRIDYNPEQYVAMVIGNLTEKIQLLYRKGGRRFGFLSLCSLGCIPILRDLNPNANKGGCFEQASALAQAHNKALKIVLAKLERQLKGFKYSNYNLYDWLLHRINHPSHYGFKDGIDACCGSGPFGGNFTCGKAPSYQLCDNPKYHVFWDSFHPSQALYEQLAKSLWNGHPPTLGPYNVRELFHAKKR